MSQDQLPHAGIKALIPGISTPAAAAAAAEGGVAIFAAMLGKYWITRASV